MNKAQAWLKISNDVNAFLAHRANKVMSFKDKIENARNEAIAAGFYGPIIDEIFVPVLNSSFVKNKGIKVGPYKKVKKNSVKIKHWNR